MNPRVAVLGSGAMGTACAVLLAGQAADVRLWGRDARHVDDLARHRENRRLLPGIRVPASVVITSDAAVALADAQFAVVAIPTRYLQTSLSALSHCVPPQISVVSVVKGIENSTFRRPSQLIQAVWGSRPIIALSGPCHAEEAARGLPASLVAAADDIAWSARVQELFTSDRFRVYTNADLLGVELAGALKNVIAIAAGISDGLGYGDNAKAALLTRGMVEMTRFGVVLGAKATTFGGLAGIGDLLTTCVSPHGRNRWVGEQLGQGRTLDSILGEMAGVAEGVGTCASVMGLARSREIEMPIVTEVYQVLFDGKSPAEATDSLMLRPTREE